MTVPPQPTQTLAPLPTALAHLRSESRDSPPLPGGITGTGREYDMPIAVSQHGRDPSPLRASTTNENSSNAGASRAAPSKDGPQIPTPPGTPRPLGVISPLEHVLSQCLRSLSNRQRSPLRGLPPTRHAPVRLIPRERVGQAEFSAITPCLRPWEPAVWGK
jgi:hypothetical protein